MPGPDATDALIDLLDFYAEAGVDAFVGETGFDRFAAEKTARETRRESFAKPAAEAPRPRAPAEGTASLGRERPHGRSGAGPKPDSPEAVMAAREAVAGAETLDRLRDILDGFEGVSLKHTAKRLVFGDGNPGARVMLIGEKPGAEEDQEGKPFCGRSGMLLDRMLLAIGLKRADVYIANIVPWRPPANRTPTPQEVEILRPFTERQITLVGPNVLVALGGPATNMLLRSKDGILKTRGRWHDFAGETGTLPVLPMLHPAYLLRQPLQKRVAWHDLLTLKEALARDA